MILRIVQESGDEKTVMRLIGRIESEHLHDLEAQIANETRTIVLDLSEIKHVVGGPPFEPCLQCLAQRGRLVAIGSVRDGRVRFNLTDFYHRDGWIFGVDTLKFDFAESVDVLREIMPGVEHGLFKPPALETVTLDQAVDDYRKISDGRSVTKKEVIAFTSIV